jgi:mono/diheme cytochrome c family protein
VTRHSAEIALGLLAVVCTVVLLTGVATAEDARMAREVEAQRAQAIEVGADLYDLHCRSCHGANGQGVGQMGPSLADAHFFTDRLQEVGWPGTLEEYVMATTELGRVVATRPLYAGDGVVVMSAWSEAFGGPLRRDQIRDLAAFVLNWQATALGEVELRPLEMPRASLDDPEAIARGRALFSEVGCSGCHAVDGVSAAEVGPDLGRVASVAATRQPGLTAEEYLREAILIPNAYFVEGFERTAKSNMCGGVLSEEQLDELVAFLLTLD